MVYRSAASHILISQHIVSIHTLVEDTITAPPPPASQHTGSGLTGHTDSNSSPPPSGDRGTLITPPTLGLTGHTDSNSSPQRGLRHTDNIPAHYLQNKAGSWHILPFLNPERKKASAAGVKHQEEGKTFSSPLLQGQPSKMLGCLTQLKASHPTKWS